MLKRDFDAVNTERLSAGEEPWKNPRNADRRLLEAARRRASARAARCRCCSTSWSTASVPGAPFRGARVVARLGLPGLARHPIVAGLTGAGGPGRVLGQPTSQLPYEADGLVVKVDDVRRTAIAGRHGQVSPLGHRLQVPGPARGDALRGIEINVGRTGAVTPVAVLDPVELSGHDREARVDVQLGRGGPARCPCRRSRDGREGGRDHPAGHRGARRGAHRERDPYRGADRVSELLITADPARGRGGAALPESGVPRSTMEGGSVLLRARAPSTSRGSARSWPRSWCARGW
jgi:hypothetical protein